MFLYNANGFGGWSGLVNLTRCDASMPWAHTTLLMRNRYGWPTARVVRMAVVGRPTARVSTELTHLHQLIRQIHWNENILEHMGTGG